MLSQAGGALSTSASECSTNRSWLASERIGALLTTLERSSLCSELVHGDRWKRGSGVVLGLILVDFVDWNGGVHDGWLDSLLLDDWLDGLMDVVVDVLASDGGSSGCGMLGLANSSSILELSLLSSKTLLDGVIISMLDVAVLDTNYSVRVLFG
jgi:hypothetical protein